MKRIATISVTALCLSMLGLAGASAAEAGTIAPAAAAKKYKNCTALHQDYEHGLRKKGAKDKVRGKTAPVATRLIPVRTKIYNANTKLDRDKDGVACEAR
ncbi:excalibur calcium-binding domain-containing protein [Kineosporia sp. J2-2]|uniref:Excalibur calcium-binding domain-containing protein n=1 Tax=Kineosporia corallincola TaxID=2835133 RepID=A0ABS5TB57_9ACTN|nr:excalibur calcium-binding domain-containing protein [Kineosporia corallincola]MBT0768295.1 excalibur calcium-binding domain-containing protein [Kineosporia corallincola]